MPNYGYHLARAEGKWRRAVYSLTLPIFARRPIYSPRDLPFEVYTYSGQTTLPEQIASIRSFFHHAGRPQKFTVVSDGTHSSRSLALLRSLDPVVYVSQFTDWIPANSTGDLRTYLSTHPTGKQLALIMSLPVAGPALYLDSDVLFFPGASEMELNLNGAPALYLPDCQLSADERLLRTPAERERPVNTGVLFLAQKLDWSLALDRFRSLEDPPTFFTNQTLTHLAMHANGAIPLDPRKFVLQLDDQFVYADRYAGSEIALRHYVNPVRHKFWNALWR